MKVVRGMAKAETGVLHQVDKALDHVVSDDSHDKGPTWGNVDALDTPHRREVLGSGVDAFFSPPPKRPSPKKRSTPRKKVTSPRTEDHHLGALFDACGPGTSPRVSPRVSPRPSLDGDDDEQALFDAIIVDDESSPRASPRTSPMPSPKLPPPTQSTTPHLASSGFNFDALPAPGADPASSNLWRPVPDASRTQVRASPPSARSARRRRLQHRLPGNTPWRTRRRMPASRRSTTRWTTRARRYELTVLFCFNSVLLTTGTGTRTTTTASRSAPSGTDYNSATPPRSSNTSLVNWTRCTWGSRN